MAMMYVAKRDLKLGNGVIRKRGQPIPEAETWREHIRMAHERLGWIKYEDYDAAKPAPKAAVVYESTPLVKEEPPVVEALPPVDVAVNKPKKKPSKKKVKAEPADGVS